MLAELVIRRRDRHDAARIRIQPRGSDTRRAGRPAARGRTPTSGCAPRSCGSRPTSCSPAAGRIRPSTYRSRACGRRLIPALVGHRHPPAAGATFAADAVTILYAPPRSPAAPLASPLAGPAADVQLGPGPARCRAGATTCVFEAGGLALVFDRDGRSDVVRVTRVFDDALGVRPIAGGSVQAFAAGASIVPLELRSYYHDRAAAQLRYQDGWVTDVPVLDDVVGLTLRYFGGGALPAGGGGDGLAAACLRGRPPAPPPGRAGDPERELAPSLFLDGPRCGGRLPYDVDLFRIRRVQVEIRLQVSGAWLRGRDPSLFARPGPARDGRRQVPDLTGVFDVALRGP